VSIRKPEIDKGMIQHIARIYGIVGLIFRCTASPVFLPNMACAPSVALLTSLFSSMLAFGNTVSSVSFYIETSPVISFNANKSSISSFTNISMKK
jgi:hypothetical protein